MSTAFPLNTPCPQCNGPVVYSGTGRRPEYCSPACVRAVRAADARARRARAASPAHPTPAIDPQVAARSAERRARVAAMPRFVLDDRPERGDWMPTLDDFADVELSESFGTDSAKHEGYLLGATARANDPAAAWLAEHYPEALADFPHAPRMGRTV